MAALQRADQKRNKIRQDWAKNGKIWVDRDCFFSCWDKIWRWLDLGSLLGMLMKHDLVKDEEDFFLINNPHKSPREKADNLLQKIVANSGDVGYYLLYVCIRDDTGNPLGHADAVRELVAYARKNNVQPPDWVLNDDQYMDVAQPEEGGGRSSGTPTLPGQSASVTSRPAEEHVKVTPQAKVSGRPPVAMVTSRQQSQGMIPVAGGHSKGEPQPSHSGILQPQIVKQSFSVSKPSNLSGPSSLQSGARQTGGVSLIGSAASNSNRGMRGDTVEIDTRLGMGAHTQPPSQPNSGRDNQSVAETIMSLVQKSAFQQIVKLNENGVDVEFASPDCQKPEDVLFTMLRFFVACMNARNTLKYGVFLAGVKGEADQPPFGPVKLQFDPESAKSRITSLLNRCVFAKHGEKERPLNAEESKQLKLEIIPHTPPSSPNLCLVCIVMLNIAACASNLYVFKSTLLSRDEVLTRCQGGYLRYENTARIRQLQKALEVHFLQWNNQ